MMCFYYSLQPRQWFFWVVWTLLLFYIIVHVVAMPPMRLNP